MNIQEALQFKKLVTFIPNKREPIHNWYYFKEGFSKQLVDFFLSHFQINKDQIVLDPFCGVGTTNLSCKQNRIESIGFDISPLSVFVSRVKTADYDIEDLEKSVTSALKWKFERPKKIPQEDYIRKAFPIFSLEDIIFYRNKILEISDEKIRNFLFLALVDSSIKSSFARKEGAVVKIFKKRVPPVSKLFKYKIRKMLRDLKITNLDPIPTKIETGDARLLNLENDSVDCVITSPPYLNKIEYTKIYKLELSLFFDYPETQLRSYVGKGEDAERDYFDDMKKALNEIYRVSKDGARVVVVIGGGCFPDHVVLCDERIAETAKNVGFKVNQILIARNLWCTRARTIKVGKTRESIITMEK